MKIGYEVLARGYGKVVLQAHAMMPDKDSSTERPHGWVDIYTHPEALKDFTASLIDDLHGNAPVHDILFYLRGGALVILTDEFYTKTHTDTLAFVESRTGHPLPEVPADRFVWVADGAEWLFLKHFLGVL